MEGDETERALAFADTYRMLNNRISIFTSLPLTSLDKTLAATAARRHRQDKDRRHAREGLSVAQYSCGQRIGAEFIGSAFLLATVIGSGIMGERLAGGNEALALLGNTLPTGAILVVLITMLGPISGAHFNPAVTGVFWLKKEIDSQSCARVCAGAAGRCHRRSFRRAPDV